MYKNREKRNKFHKTYLLKKKWKQNIKVNKSIKKLPAN